MPREMEMFGRKGGLVVEKNKMLLVFLHLHFLWPQFFTSPSPFQVGTEGRWIVFILSNHKLR